MRLRRYTRFVRRCARTSYATRCGLLRIHCDSSHFSPRVGGSPVCTVFMSPMPFAPTLSKISASPCAPRNFMPMPRKLGLAAFEIVVEVHEARLHALPFHAHLLREIRQRRVEEIDVRLVRLRRRS